MGFSKDEPHADLMRAFIGGGVTGCEFARSLQKHRKGDAISWLTVPEIVGFELAIELTIDAASSAGKACGVVFPNLSSEESIVGALADLCKHPRWRGKVLSWQKKHPDDRIPFGLYWTTRRGGDVETSALGVASMFSMPVTRRGPGVAIIIYAGDHLNPFRDVEEGVHQGFVAMSPGATVTQDSFNTLWKDTIESINAVREAGMKPNIAFVFSAEMKGELAKSFPEST